ncbi:hypothetical protein Ga0061062_103491 [Comamonas thiooxydans]|nr:hypothetical protein Ga0061062_103491 [Comamonas thiooxydans]
MGEQCLWTWQAKLIPLIQAPSTVPLCSQSPHIPKLAAASHQEPMFSGLAVSA